MPNKVKWTEASRRSSKIQYTHSFVLLLTVLSLGCCCRYSVRGGFKSDKAKIYRWVKKRDAWQIGCHCVLRDYVYILYMCPCVYMFYKMCMCVSVNRHICFHLEFGFLFPQHYCISPSITMQPARPCLPVFLLHSFLIFSPLCFYTVIRGPWGPTKRVLCRLSWKPR